MVAASLEIAATLRDAGCKPADRVAIVRRPDRSWVASLAAIQLIGAVDVPIDRSLPPDRVIDACEQADCRFLLGGIAADFEGVTSRARPIAVTPQPSIQQHPAGRLLNTLQCDLAQRSPNALSTILFTSGTTKKPKGVLLSHANLSSNAAAKLLAVPQQRDEIRLSVLPLAHAYARTCDLGTWLIAGGILGLCSPKDLLPTLPRLRPHFINLVPLLIQRLCDAATEGNWKELTGGRLKSIGCGGAALGEDAFERLTSAGIDVIHGYGTTETSPVICTTRTGEGRAGFVGPPAAGVEIRLDEQMQLLCRGPNVCLGYLDDHNATRQRWRAGWWCTGDVAQIAADGQVKILGRLDETLILSNGRKLQPAAIEQQLCRSPHVRHVMLAVVAGELTALVDPQSGCNARAEQLHSEFLTLLERNPSWEQPRKVALFDRPLSLEMNELNHKGTLRRGTIRKHFAELLQSLESE